MKLDTNILCILFTAMGVVKGDPLIYEANLNKLVLNTTTFPAAHRPYGMSLLSRASKSEPVCSSHFGQALVNETTANIGHLSDVANVTCRVPAATCARVSHEGRSSIFFCNFECEDIETRCENLIEPAKQVSDACRIDSSISGFIYGMINGSQSYPYLVAIGDDYLFLNKP